MESHLTREQIIFFKNELENRRSKILNNLQLTSSEITSCQNKIRGDESDQASFFQGANTYKSITDRQASMLEDIELSLTKIKDKEYGICEMCEEPIPLERLKVKVFARYCISCREVIERQEAIDSK